MVLNTSLNVAKYLMISFFRQYQQSHALPGRFHDQTMASRNATLMPMNLNPNPKFQTTYQVTLFILVKCQINNSQSNSYRYVKLNYTFYKVYCTEIIIFPADTQSEIIWK